MRFSFSCFVDKCIYESLIWSVLFFPTRHYSRIIRETFTLSALCYNVGVTGLEKLGCDLEEWSTRVIYSTSPTYVLISHCNIGLPQQQAKSESIVHHLPNTHQVKRFFSQVHRAFLSIKSVCVCVCLVSDQPVIGFMGENEVFTVSSEI